MPIEKIDFTIHIDGHELKGIPDFDANSGDVASALGQSSEIIANDFLTAKIKVNRMLFVKLIGLYDWVIDYCPNRRVVHLIKHGKTKRVREKNFIRANKLLAKELKNEPN
jgi:hypothetical protein